MKLCKLNSNIEKESIYFSNTVVNVSILIISYSYVNAGLLLWMMAFSTMVESRYNLPYSWLENSDNRIQFDEKKVKRISHIAHFF